MRELRGLIQRRVGHRGGVDRRAVLGVETAVPKGSFFEVAKSSVKAGVRAEISLCPCSVLSGQGGLIEEATNTLRAWVEQRAK